MKKIKNPKRLKMPNKFGSISFLGEGRRRPFMMRAPATYDDDAKEIRPILGYSDDYYEAYETLLKYHKKSQEKEGTLRFSDLFTLWSEYKKKRFNDLKEKGKLKKNQRVAYAANYDSVYNNQCKPLHNKLLSDLCSADFQNIIDNCDKGYTTRKYIKLLGGQLFEHANYLGIKLDKEVIDRLEVGDTDKSTKHKIFTDDEIDLLWKNLENKQIDPHGIIGIVLINLYTGMRPTELLEMKTSNIDLKSQIMIGGIKTNAGIDREIPIHNKILPLIENRYNLKNEYLITKENSKPILYRHYLDLFKDVMNNLNLDHTPYDCRSTTATKLYNAGIDQLIYKLILGHDVSDITEKHYIKITAEQKLEAINRLK